MSFEVLDLFLSLLLVRRAMESGCFGIKMFNTFPLCTLFDNHLVIADSLFCKTLGSLLINQIFFVLAGSISTKDADHIVSLLFFLFFACILKHTVMP